MITKVRHIGIIVEDIVKAIEAFKNLLDLKDEDIYVMPPMELRLRAGLPSYRWAIWNLN